METREYLVNLGWDAQLWQVYNKAQAEALLAIPTYMNNMFEVKDMTGKKLFGAGSYVVNKLWVEKHKPQQEAVQTEVEEVIPPPPATEPEVLPPPVKAEVPEDLKEVAAASPNIEIVSVAPEEQEAPPAPKPMEWPNFVRTRVASFITKGWKMHEQSEDMIVSPDKETILGFEDIESLDDAKFMETLRGLKSAPEPLASPEPTAEDIKTAQDKAKADREKVEADNIFAKKNKEREETIKGRIEFLVKNGCEAIQPDGTPAVLTPDGHIFTGLELADMKNDEWMPMTVKYSAKGVADMKLALKREKEEVKKEEKLSDADKLAKDTLARRQALKAIGWTEDPDPKSQAMRSPDSEFYSYERILEVPEESFTSLLNVAVKANEQDPTEGMSAVELDVHDASEIEAKKKRSPKPDISDIETIDADEAERAYQMAIDKKTADKPLSMKRDDIAYAVMLKMVSPTSKKGADTIAKFAYELADAMLTQKLK